MKRDEAWTLLNEYTKSESLLKHAQAVEAAMRHYAAKLGENVEQWGLTGLLHDFDYERWPDIPAHTQEGAKILRERGLDEEIVEAILSHAEWNQSDYPLDRPIRKALFSVQKTGLCGWGGRAGSRTGSIRRGRGWPRRFPRLSHVRGESSPPPACGRECPASVRSRSRAIGR